MKEKTLYSRIARGLFVLLLLLVAAGIFCIEDMKSKMLLADGDSAGTVFTVETIDGEDWNVYQAEDCIGIGRAPIVGAWDGFTGTGTGFVDSPFGSGCLVDVNAAGCYKFRLSYARTGEERIFAMLVDGAIVGQIKVGDTGSWDTYKYSDTILLDLEAGRRYLSVISMGDELYNRLDRVELSVNTAEGEEPRHPAILDESKSSVIYNTEGLILDDSKNNENFILYGTKNTVYTVEITYKSISASPAIEYQVDNGGTETLNLKNTTGGEGVRSFVYTGSDLMHTIKLSGKSGSVEIVRLRQKMPGAEEGFIRYEAEYGRANSDALWFKGATNNGTSGTGHVEAFDVEDRKLEIKINVPAEGLYRMRLKYNTGSANATMKMDANGKTYEFLLSVVSDWGDFVENAIAEIENVELRKGENTVSIYKGAEYARADYIEVAKEPTAQFPEYEVTYDVNGVKNIVSSGAELTLHDSAEQNGAKFVGWMNAGKLHFGGAKVPLTANTEFEALFINAELTDGAGLRISDYAGVRFRMQIGKAGMEALDAAENVAFTCGALILPTDTLTEGKTFDLSATGFTADVDILDIICSDKNVKANLEKGWYITHYVISNLQSRNYDRAFSCRGYIKIIIENEEKYFYTDYAAEKNSRSAHQTAMAALKNGNCNVVGELRIGRGGKGGFTVAKANEHASYNVMTSSFENGKGCLELTGIIYALTCNGVEISSAPIQIEIDNKMYLIKNAVFSVKDNGTKINFDYEEVI